MKMQMTFAIVLIGLMSGCGTSMTPDGGATEAELCRAWGGSLPTRSHSDTDQTKDEIQAGYAIFAAACPDWDHLIP